MQPIEDFDLGIDPNSLICFDTPEEPHELDAPPQPHSRLRELPGVDDWDRTLRYRGQRIPDLRIRGEQIEAQFRTQSGYLLFVSSRDHAWFLSHLDVYYVLDDFSGAEWASVMTWETGELFQPRWYIWLLRAGYLRHILEVGPQPLRHIEAIDERTVQFYVIRHGWYQLTLHDDPRNASSAHTARSVTKMAIMGMLGIFAFSNCGGMICRRLLVFLNIVITAFASRIGRIGTRRSSAVAWGSTSGVLLPRFLPPRVAHRALALPE